MATSNLKNSFYNTDTDWILILIVYSPNSKYIVFKKNRAHVVSCSNWAIPHRGKNKIKHSIKTDSDTDYTYEYSSDTHAGSDTNSETDYSCWAWILFLLCYWLWYWNPQILARKLRSSKWGRLFWPRILRPKSDFRPKPFSVKNFEIFILGN